MTTYPSAATCGPAAGGYSSPTLVNLTANQNINLTGNPSWAVVSGTTVTISNVTFTVTNNATIVVKNTVTNVVFQGCTFNCSAGVASSSAPTMLNLQQTGLATVTYCTFYADGTSATRIMEVIDQAANNALTVTYCDISDFKQAVNLYGGTTAGVNISGNYFHGEVLYSGDHSECIYAGATVGGSNISITGNTLYNPLNQTAAVYFNDVYPFYNCTISGNLLAGGDYPIYCGGSASTGMVVTNNVFSTTYFADSGYYGPVYTSPLPAWGVSGNVWSNNTWYDGPNINLPIAGPGALPGIPTPSVLAGNILSVADSLFTGGWSTWQPNTNANTPVLAAYSFVGSQSMAWTATTAGDTIISTGMYPCNPNTGMDFSGFVLTPWGNHNVFIGVSWYTAASVLISTTWPGFNASNQNDWQPYVCAATSPPTATQFQVMVWISNNVQASEPFAIDLVYAADVPAQVLIDWTNPAFSANAYAGGDFMDVTPWVRFDQNIGMSRGRQDAVSEIQAGQATLQLQNDSGWFTPQNTNSPLASVSLGARTQVNVVDQVGNWNTRFDGAVTEITYAADVTGNTNVANISCSDIMAYMNRQDVMACWAKSVVLNDNPWLHWSLNDKGDTNTGAETSGNNGPILRMVNCTGSGSIAWQNSNGGVETLANAIKAGNPNGAEYWQPGSITPISAVRGLDSGTVGPVGTPLSSTYFTPNLTVESGYNLFVGNGGGQLNAELYMGGLPAPIQANNPANSYSIECWFAMDPNISTAAQASKKYGPYTVLSLGSGRTGGCIVAGVYPWGSSIAFELSSYAQPPSFPQLQFGTAPQSLQVAQVTMPLETTPLPHHLVINIQGEGVGGIATVYLDNVSLGSITLPSTQIFDTICVGGAYGGYGAFYGNIQLVSIYQYALTQAQITQHCSVGQYGYWEQTTDNAVCELANIAGIPKYWNNTQNNYYGLTVAEYLDVTGTTPIGNMQLYEQAERGLLFINSQGQLTFHTRDWRMGYGAPDLTIPAGVYDADLGYELIDTFLLNEASTGTSTFSDGTAWTSLSSENTYGVYANGTQASPIQLPLITCSRAYTELGLSQYGYWSDPSLNDVSAWQVNTRNQPRLTCGQLTFDLLTLDVTSALTITEFYSLDIDNMVTLGGLPASFPNVAGATDLFIEGMNETVGQSTHTLSLYTSPASVQRAWKPGDPTYGQLGSTSRIGVSAPDTSMPPALGKAVSHDAGGPYWPPLFATPTIGMQLGYANATGSVVNIYPTVSSQQGQTILVQILAAASTTITSVVDSVNGGLWYTLLGSVTLSSGQVQYLYAGFNLPLAVPNSAYYTVSTSTSQEYTTSVYAIDGITGADIAATTAIGTSTTPAITGGGPLSSSTDYELVVVANNNSEGIPLTPSGWSRLGNNFQGTYQNQIFYRVATSTTPDPFSATLSGSSTPWGAIAVSLTVSPFSMNNPAANGHGFVGALDIRGLHDNLSTALAPPMCVVGAANHTQSYATGNIGLASERLIFDSVYIDTAGGMGVVPGWPNWYCCMQPGFYEIDSTLNWQTQSSAAGQRNGWIIVAQAAAQAVAAGTGTPTTVNRYVCPIGESVPGNVGSLEPVANASTRVYLGLGDMVTLGAMQNSGGTITTGRWPYAGSTLSLRWVGYSTLGDQLPVCQSPGNGMFGAGQSQGGGNPVTTTTGYWSGSYCYSYFGAGASYGDGNKLSEYGGPITQGKYQNGVNGSCYGAVLFNYANMHSTLSGHTINWMQCKATNTHSWYNSGCKLMLGTTNITNYGTWANMRPGVWTWFDETEVSFNEGQTKWFNLPVSHFGSLGSTAVGLVIGNNSTTNLEYYSTWGTGPNSWELAINYT